MPLIPGKMKTKKNNPGMVLDLCFMVMATNCFFFIIYNVLSLCFYVCSFIGKTSKYEQLKYNVSRVRNKILDNSTKKNKEKYKKKV